MVEVVPFKGLLYDETLAGPFRNLVAPPYDVIRPNMQDDLYNRSPHNVVRLILGRQFDADAEDNNRYTRSAKDFADWIQRGILKRDERPAFYVYGQEYRFNGQDNHRIGFFARVGLEDFSKGNICPHEFTLSKAKMDRARLIRACKANFSPVFGLFSDPDGVVDKTLNEIIQQTPLIEIQDDTIMNRLWRVTDPEALKFLSSQFTHKKVYIADGHHRYETSLGYYKEHGKDVPEAAHVMMFLTNLDAQSLAIYPIHRQVKCPEPFNRADFVERLKPYFEVEAVAPNANADHLVKQLENTGQEQIAFTVYFGQGDAALLKVKDTESIVPYLAPDEPRELQVLDVCQLHVLILRHLMGIDTKNPDHQQYIGYNVRPKEAMEQVDEGKFDLAFYMNPTRIDQVRDLAEKGIRLPQKATYFYPKLLSGLVINPFTP